jgi:hypothetical protein
VAAWPLLETYPGPRFQSGLFGTWMFAQKGKDGAKRRGYSDIEGGLGWWRDTRFATTTPKFIMGGVALDFSAWANGPGAGKGRDWSKPQGKYGVAQLSPWLLWPPDGLNLEQGTAGELFGYGYLPLPLMEARQRGEQDRLPTGGQCWTLFLNTANFKGPVAFFTPWFFARSTAGRKDLQGMLLDSRPADPNRALQMETQYIPSVSVRDEEGRLWARVAPTRFPVDQEGRSILVHRVASYRTGAFPSRVAAWLRGGKAASGSLPAEETVFHEFTGKGWSSWKIRVPGQKKNEAAPVDWQSYATPSAADPHTFAYRWEEARVTSTGGGLVTLPTYYRLEGEGKRARWVPRIPEEGAVKTKLDAADLSPRKRPTPAAYVTPEEGCWKEPGPVAGPFRVRLGDGSRLTYSWYRFSDQPALQNAQLGQAERALLQRKVEKIHRAWQRDGRYLAPPTRGRLARLDPALIVTPPGKYRIGYVPVVTRQEAAR